MPFQVVRYAVALAVFVAASAAAPLFAHHSYLMFDGARTKTVTGTIAKVE